MLLGAAMLKCKLEVFKIASSFWPQILTAGAVSSDVAGTECEKNPTSAW